MGHGTYANTTISLSSYTFTQSFHSGHPHIKIHKANFSLLKLEVHICWIKGYKGLRRGLLLLTRQPAGYRLFFLHSSSLFWVLVQTGSSRPGCQNQTSGMCQRYVFLHRWQATKKTGCDLVRCKIFLNTTKELLVLHRLIILFYVLLGHLISIQPHMQGGEGGCEGWRALSSSSSTFPAYPPLNPSMIVLMMLRKGTKGTWNTSNLSETDQ